MATLPHSAAESRCVQPTNRLSEPWASPAEAYRRMLKSHRRLTPPSKQNVTETNLTHRSRKEQQMTKTILVTGAGSGFGKGAALGLAKDGYNIIATVHVASQVTPLREEAKAIG